MRRQLFFLLCLICALVAQAQVQVIKVYPKDGTPEKTFKVDKIEHIAFEAETSEVFQKNGKAETFRSADIDRMTFEEVTPIRLTNQYAVNDKIHNIGSAVREQVEGGYRFALYEAEGVTSMDENPALSLFVADAAIGKTLDLGTMTEAEATISMADAPQYAALTGTLRVAYDKFGRNLIVSLEAETDAYDDIRAAYTGAFTTAYSASGLLCVTPNEGDTEEGKIGSFFRMAATEIGGATHFALGLAEADAPAGLSAGHYALWISVSASALYNGPLNLAEATGSYTIRLMDYAAGQVVEGATEGTLTTYAADERVYIAVKATLADGTQIEAEFFGLPADVESLEAMLPEIKRPNEYTYYNADGKVSTQYTITSVTRTTTGKGLYEFRLCSDEEGSYNSPRLTVSPDLVNAGDIDLSQLQPNTFQIKYNSFQLYSPDGDYRHIPTNGTMNISCDEAGNYKIYFEATNDYYTTQSGQTSYGGDNTRLVISYTGSVTEK